MKEPKTILKYGIKNGKRVHIQDVESGLKCNCKCPCCGEDLIAKKGKKATPQEHFAHKSKKECEHIYETSIHYEAKEIIEKERKIRLPINRYEFNDRNIQEIIDSKLNGKNLGKTEYKEYEIGTVKLEKKLHNIVPDILADINGNTFLIEIVVTSFVKEEKLKKIENIGIPVLEIDLSKTPRKISTEYLTEVLLSHVDNKNWIFNPKEAIINSMLQDRGNEIFEKILEARETKIMKGSKENPFVIDCPHPLMKNNFMRKAYIKQNCRNCEYLYFEYEDYINCVGRKAREIRKFIIEKNYEIKKEASR